MENAIRMQTMEMLGSEEDAVEENPHSIDRTGSTMNFSQCAAIANYYTQNLFWPILVSFHPYLGLSEGSDVLWPFIRKLKISDVKILNSEDMIKFLMF